MNSYIFLNEKLFQYISRIYTEQKIGSKLERTLSGIAKREIVTTKRKWSFTFEFDERQYYRIKSIFDLNTQFILIDWDLSTYTVISINDFAPTFDGTYFQITLDIEEM